MGWPGRNEMPAWRDGQVMMTSITQVGRPSSAATAGGGAPTAGAPVTGAPVGGDGARLVALARETATSRNMWQPGTSWSQARNAHETNTASEMEAALRSDVNWLEG